MFRKSSLILLATILLSTLYFTGISFAQDTPESQAKKVVEDFFAAMDKGDIDGAMDLTKDSRYSNPVEQAKAYQEYRDSRSFKHLEILSAVVVNTESAFVKVKNDSTPPDVTEVIVVKKYNGQWKIALGDYKKESKQSTDFSINTVADPFSFTGFMYGPHYTNDTFTIPSGVSNVVVQGWQASSNSYPANVTYQLARSLWTGYQVYGSPADVYGNEEYVRTLSGAFAGSGFCIEIYINDSSVVNGAGNVMYNP